MVCLSVPGTVKQITKEVAKQCVVLAKKNDENDKDEKDEKDLEDELGLGRSSLSSLSLSSLSSLSSPPPSTSTSTLALGLTCGACGMIFESRDVQAAHFKTDHHRLNVKRALKGRPPLSLDVLEAILAAGDDLSSISGSDSEDSEEEGEGGSRPAAAGSKTMVAFEYREEEGDTRTAFGIPRNVLFPWGYREEDARNECREALVRLSESNGSWAVVMASGGHFAAAVFPSAGENSKPMPHKTLHRYVVRAKAGGRQAAKDATGKKAQSAGASLRRHNEKALAEDIRTLLRSTWKEELAKADYVFLSAPGSHNASIFFGGKEPIFDKKDPRLHKIPFACRRPTLKETCRIKHLLSTIHTVGGEEQARRRKGEGSAAAVEGREADQVRAEPGRGEQGGGRGAGADQENGDAVEENPMEETELHVATREGNAERVQSLLEGGADPCRTDLRGRPPYLLAKVKEVRDVYRRFRAKAGEDRFDWKAAGVPQALTQELEEQQQRKKAAKDAKRKKEKQKRQKAQAAKKAAQEAKAKEEEEQKKKREEEQKRGPGANPFNMWARQPTKRELLARAAEERIKKMGGKPAAGPRPRPQPASRASSGVGEPRPPKSRGLWIFAAALAVFGLRQGILRKKGGSGKRRRASAGPLFATYKEGL